MWGLFGSDDSKRWLPLQLASVSALTGEEYADTDNSIITKYQKKEIDLAYELKPLIWNPSPQEMKYLKK